MLNKYLAVLQTNPLLVLFVLAMFLILFFLLGVMMGNVTAMKILVRIGIPVFSGRPLKDYRVLRSVNKDGVGWIKIPDTCYAPIMISRDGLYRNHDYRKRESIRGELFLSDGRNTLDLQSISRHSDNVFHDLAVIKGSASLRGTNLRDSQFTCLTKYVNTDLKKYNPDILLVENGKLRVFNLLFAVEIGLENSRVLTFSDRASFLSSMRGMANIDTGRDSDNDVLILSSSTGIDTMLVFLVEKTGGVDDGEGFKKGKHA